MLCWFPPFLLHVTRAERLRIAALILTEQPHQEMSVTVPEWVLAIVGDRLILCGTLFWDGSSAPRHDTKPGQSLSKSGRCRSIRTSCPFLAPR